MKEINYKEKGITLVALVITIIILLILAGVTISTALGQNGLFQRAKYAGEEYKNSEEKEQLALEDISKEIDKVSADKAGTNEEIPKNKNWDKEIVSAIADGEGGVIPLPKGFYYAGGSISTGIVISDVDNDDLDNSQKGNQFVWIPATAKAYENAAKYSAKEGGKGWTEYAYHTDVNGKEDERYKGKTGWSNPEEQMNKAKTSIEKYGGFYVARYEAGVPSDADFYVSSDTSEKTYYKNEKKNVDTYKPVSKKENQVWNYIDQTNAEKVCNKMYESNSSVESFLIDSNAWNYICGDIFEPILKKQNKTLLQSKTYGNYLDNSETSYENITGLYAVHTTNSVDVTYKYGKIGEGIAPRGEGENRLELSAGCSDDFKIYNIYDMAGNMYEWTAEKVTATNKEKGDKSYAVIRGCSFLSYGRFPIVHSLGSFYIDSFNVDIGFRPVLYIK